MDDQYARWNSISPTKLEMLKDTQQAFAASLEFNKKLCKGWADKAWFYKASAVWAKDKSNYYQQEMIADAYKVDELQDEINKLGGNHG